MAYKMKGSPMERNFNVSPVKNNGIAEGARGVSKNKKTIPKSFINDALPKGGNKSKGTLRGITQFEYDFPKVNKAVNLHNKFVKKGINTVKKNVKKGYDYFTKR